MSGLRFEQDGAMYVAPAVDVTAIWNEAKAEGVEAGKVAWRDQFLVTEVVGTGERSLKFECPFDPDFIDVYSYNVSAVSNVDDIVGVQFELGIASGVCGTVYLKISGTDRFVGGNVGFGDPAQDTQKYKRIDEKTVMIRNFSATDKTSNRTADGYFGNKKTYTVIAVKK